MNASRNYRVLVIDDNHAIHDDIRKILGCVKPQKSAKLAAAEDAIFGTGEPAVAAVPIEEPSGTHTFEVESSFQGQEGFNKVEQARREGKPYAVAFVDMRMPPGWDGLRTVREIWRCDPDINIVVCTAFSDHSWADIEAIDDAGDRLLVLKKPFEPIEVRRLAATLTAKWTLAYQAAMKMAELEKVVDERTQELHQAATHDRLTSLPNRTLFHTRLTQAMQASQKAGKNDLAVMFLDFDRFKFVNDSLGHAAGDQLLKSITGRLTAALRQTDTVAPATGMTARLGGDEFCVLLTSLRNAAEDAASVARRLLETLAVPYDLGGCRVQSTASIGIALYSSAYTTADEMIRDADTAMYRAKADGKGRYVLFDTAMHELAVRRLSLESELRQAITQGELEMHYQPVVSIPTARVVGAEALVRWRHPTRGLVSPAEFIPIAEESGLIYDLGLFVLEQSARQLQNWTVTHADGQLAVSVNVSTKQLANPDFVNDVAAILARTQVDPKRLILELTESALVANTELARRAVRGLQALGMRVFLDDFGTGYSSLSLLHTFDLNGLKIDRSFIREAATHRQVSAIVQAVTELAHNLHMEVTAEGIETVDQLMLLKRLKCDHAQGFLFSKPLPAAEFEAMVFRGKPEFGFLLPAAA
ncbi:MAG: EAL domain-containing protein [Tepidisphaeraceae bacterium]